MNPPEADERRLFPNSGFRHSELGRKILNAPKAHKSKELIKELSADIGENLRPNLNNPSKRTGRSKN
jgi:hypothetical protein